MAFDPATNFVYVPDNATKGRGVWRLSFNPISQTLGSPVLLANGGGGTGGNRASAVALGPDGKLYVVFGRNRNILRITNPAGSVATQIVESVGLVADRRVGPPAIAFVGEDLYLAENGVGVTVVSSARLCQNNNCTAFLTSSSVAAPTFITSDAGGLLYIADGSFVFRFNPATAVEEVYATGAIDSLGASIAFQNISALGLDSTGNLYIGDDTTAGAFILTGRVFSAPPPPPPGP
jgi:DNA-binding beta-propeller fold protein YncE